MAKERPNARSEIMSNVMRSAYMDMFLGDVHPDRVGTVAFSEETSFGESKGSIMSRTCIRMKGSADRRAASEKPWVIARRLRPWAVLSKMLWVLNWPTWRGRDAHALPFLNLLEGL